jgi:hypothetical protein
MNTDYVCTVEGCTRPRWVRMGYCSLHYSRWTRHGTTDRPGGPPGKKHCTVDGCGAPSMCRAGYCAKHYARLKKTGTLEPPQVEHGTPKARSAHTRANEPYCPACAATAWRDPTTPRRRKARRKANSACYGSFEDLTALPSDLACYIIERRRRLAAAKRSQK